SVRRGRRVVQETVAHLGELDAQGRAKARALAQQITGRGAQHELFEAEGTPGEAIAVRLDQIRLERSRAFGAVWLGWTLWRALGWTPCARSCCPQGARRALGDDGRGPGARPPVRAVEGTAYRRGLVPRHRAGGLARGPERAGQRRPAVPRPRPAAAAQARDRGPSEGAPGRALRARLRPAAYDVTSTYF